MSLRLEMLRAVRQASNQLHEATDRVIEFLQSQFNEDGGAKDRSGKSDLYYAVFALDGLAAMRGDIPFERVIPYLRGFGAGERLDLVHCACLARCWAVMPDGPLDANTRGRILQRVELHRSTDGGYGPQQGGDVGTVYCCFLALGAYQDLNEQMPNLERLAGCLAGLQTSDGGYANEHSLKFATTPTTAAAVTLMRQLHMPVRKAACDWLLARCHEDGGFLAVSGAPFPDLLSTATALHALVTVNAPLDKIKQPCLDFLNRLWTGRAFRGHVADDVEDCEYMYYALLALGHLS